MMDTKTLTSVVTCCSFQDGFVDTFDRVHQRPWLSTEGKLLLLGVGFGLLSVLL